jgi:hypothetical protein
LSVKRDKEHKGDQSFGHSRDKKDQDSPPKDPQDPSTPSGRIINLTV